MESMTESEALFESMHDQLFLAWSVSPSSWFDDIDEEWRRRVQRFVQFSIKKLLPVYARSMSYTAALPPETSVWLIENARDGLAAVTRCIEQDVNRNGFTVDQLALVADDLRFERHANQRRHRFISLPPYIVSFQHGLARPHVLTVDVYGELGEYLDGFAVYSFSTDLSTYLRTKLKLAVAGALDRLGAGVEALVINPNDWPSFFRVMEFYPQPSVEDLVSLELLPESALHEDDEQD